MKYSSPELSYLGSLASLTLGNNGSCLDGNGEVDQKGGGFQDGGGDNHEGHCGPSD